MIHFILEIFQAILNLYFKDVVYFFLKKCFVNVSEFSAKIFIQKLPNSC